MRSQAGYTLVEMILALGIGTMLIAGTALLLWTMFTANHTSDVRLQASAQIRNFQLAFHDDVVLNNRPVSITGNCTPPGPCTISLSGSRFNQGASGPGAFSVTYSYSSGTVTRQVSGAGATEVAKNVARFCPGVSAGNVVTVNLTAQDSLGAYSETQTLKFDPRPVSSPTPVPTAAPC
jgi:prepilin-type N-terminal cleavage/methylation domain-containing protein